MKLEKYENIHCQIFLVTKDFDAFKTGQVIHRWGKRGVIIAATAIHPQQVARQSYYWSIFENIDKIRFLTLFEIKKYMPHLNYRGKQIAVMLKRKLTTS